MVTIINTNMQFVHDWSNRMKDYFGIKTFYTKDKQRLSQGLLAMYVARGPQWNESLHYLPDPSDEDLRRLQEFENNLPNLPDWLIIPDYIIKEIQGKKKQ